MDLDGLLGSQPKQQKKKNDFLVIWLSTVHACQLGQTCATECMANHASQIWPLATTTNDANHNAQELMMQAGADPSDSSSHPS